MNDPVATTAAALSIHIVVMLAFRHLYLRLIPAAFDRIMGFVPHPNLVAYMSFVPKAVVVFMLLPFLVGAFLCLALLSDWKHVDGQLMLLPHCLHALSDKRMLTFVRVALKA